MAIESAGGLTAGQWFGVAYMYLVWCERTVELPVGCVYHLNHVPDAGTSHLVDIVCDIPFLTIFRQTPTGACRQLLGHDDAVLGGATPQSIRTGTFGPRCSKPVGTMAMKDTD